MAPGAIVDRPSWLLAQQQFFSKRGTGLGVSTMVVLLGAYSHRVASGPPISWCDQAILVVELIRVADEMAMERPDWEVEVAFPDDEFDVWRAMVMNAAWKVRSPGHKHSK